MVVSRLEILIQELSQTNIMSSVLSTAKSLRPNANNTCLIPMGNDLKVQFELDKEEKKLLIGCVLGNVTASAYRHKLFAEALRANGMPPPRYGILAYSQKTFNLLLFDYLDMRDLTGNKVSEYLAPFLEKAKTWKEAIASGNIPSIKSSQGSGERSIFGMKF